MLPSNPAALREAASISDGIVRDVEAGKVPLSRILLRVLRLTRLLEDTDGEKMFRYEATGYPCTAQGIALDIWEAAVRANRQFSHYDSSSDEFVEHVYTDSLDEIEVALTKARAKLKELEQRLKANDQPFSRTLTEFERKGTQSSVDELVGRYSSRKWVIHEYVMRVHYQLRFSSATADVFTRWRVKIDRAITLHVPESVKRFAAVSDNLTSSNPEDWSNAVHSCRRILQDLADALYSPRSDRMIQLEGRTKVIKLGPDQYINRLVAYAEERSNSGRFDGIVGSHLRYLGDRLDATFQAAQKGSHSTIVSLEEAERYVVYTYMVVGDLLSLAAEA